MDICPSKAGIGIADLCERGKVKKRKKPARRAFYREPINTKLGCCVRELLAVNKGGSRIDWHWDSKMQGAYFRCHIISSDLEKGVVNIGTPHAL